MHNTYSLTQRRVFDPCDRAQATHYQDASGWIKPLAPSDDRQAIEGLAFFFCWLRQVLVASIPVVTVTDSIDEHCTHVRRKSDGEIFAKEQALRLQREGAEFDYLRIGPAELAAQPEPRTIHNFCQEMQCTPQESQQLKSYLLFLRWSQWLPEMQRFLNS